MSAFIGKESGLVLAGQLGSYFEGRIQNSIFCKKQVTEGSDSVIFDLLD